MVLKALGQIARPVTARQLRERLTGPFKLTEDRLTGLLDDQVKAGQVHRFAPIGKSKLSRYSTRNLEQYARETLLRLLAQRPQTRSELIRRLKSPLAEYTEQQRQKLLTALANEGRIYELPALIGGRSKFYSAQPADPRPYLEDAIDKIGRKLGLKREDVIAAARELAADEKPVEPKLQNDLSEKLLARMLQVKLAAAQGGLVPLNQLWRSLKNEGWDKTSFDRTVLSLAEKYRVSLQRHNFPAGLSEEERSELVADELGNYYVGIALR